MNNQINWNNPDRNQIDQLTEAYGNKFVVQKLFSENGLTAIETRLITPDATDEEIQEAVSQIFSKGKGATVRFSYGNELNLPRGFFDDPVACMNFIRNERKDYALILQEYTQLEDSFELYMDDNRIYLQAMPGIWEVDSNASPDIVEMTEDGTKVYRYKGTRTAKYLDESRRFTQKEDQPYTIAELETFFSEVLVLRDKLEAVRGLYDPLFCHFYRDTDGRLSFINIRNFGEIQFNSESPDDLYSISNVDDLANWDGSTSILFNVQSDRSNDTPIMLAIEKLKEIGVKEVFVNYGILSHPAILLREAGIEAKQTFSDYEIRDFGETRSIVESEEALPDGLITAIYNIEEHADIEGYSRRIVISLKDITETDRKIVGGKAYNLGILARNGFNVPNGFVISTEAYADWIKAENIGTDQLSMLQRLIVSYRKLNANRVAVRSSATVEDMTDTSSAGVYETTLNVKDVLHLVGAVIKGFRSFNQQNAVLYRETNKIGQGGEMALVVQEMISADTAGVVFSSNPITGERGQIVVNSVKGIGEPLVSGRLSGDTFVVGNDGVLISESINPQDFKLTLDGEIPVQESERLQPSLTTEQLSEIALIAKKIEDLYGVPQDIEFAIKDGEIWILQARPITTFN